MKVKKKKERDMILGGVEHARNLIVARSITYPMNPIKKQKSKTRTTMKKWVVYMSRKLQEALVSNKQSSFSSRPVTRSITHIEQPSLSSWPLTRAIGNSRQLCSQSSNQFTPPNITL
mgnify:CR=1 FL=1